MSDSDRSERTPTIGDGLSILTAIILSCFIVGTLTFSLGRDGERDTERAAEYQNYSDERQAAFCTGLVGLKLSQCEIEQQQAATQAYQAERDLEAQRDMSLWALAVFVISAVTAGLTLWALFYVRRTLSETREAVRETKGATVAMVRQNELTMNGQRPWITISGELLSIERDGPNVKAEINCSFNNIGKMIAEEFYAEIAATFFAADMQQVVTGICEYFKARIGGNFGRKVSVIPGDILPFPKTVTENFASLPWIGDEFNGTYCYFVVIALCCYKVPNDSNWHHTIQTFFIGEKRGGTDHIRFFQDRSNLIKVEDYRFVKSGVVDVS